LLFWKKVNSNKVHKSQLAKPSQSCVINSVLPNVAVATSTIMIS